MKIIIDIPEEKYNRLVYLSDVDLKEYIKNGIPLDDITEELDKRYFEMKKENICYADGLEEAIEIIEHHTGGKNDN